MDFDENPRFVGRERAGRSVDNLRVLLDQPGLVEVVACLENEGVGWSILAGSDPEPGVKVEGIEMFLELRVEL